MKLTAEQLEAINKMEHNLQIIACAGSGKTEVIVRRIANILDNKAEIHPENIVAFTFTEKAADSMKNRIRQILSRSGKELTEGMYVGTIHGFCSHLLSKYSDRFKDFKVLDTVKNHLFVARYYDKCGMRDLNLNPYPMDVKLFLECIEKMVDNFSNNDQWDELHRNVFDKYRSCLYAHKYIDFALLIFEAIQQIRSNPIVKNYLSTIKYFIVDEYQDIDDLQEQLIQLFAKHETNICVVGDDDQTIYQFRGSNANNMICFSNRYSDVSQIRLEKNFRCAASIVDVAAHVIGFNKNRIQKTMVSEATNNGVSSVTAKRFDLQHDEYKAISEQITALHAKGIPYSEIAILVRKGKYINPICLSLETYGIPYVSDSAEHFFEGIYFKRFVNTLRTVVDNINKAKLYECWSGYVDENYFNMGFRYLRQEVRRGGNGQVLPLSSLFKEFLNKIDFFNANVNDIKDRQEAIEGFSAILDDYDEIYQDSQFSYRITGVLKFLDTQAVDEYKYHNFKSEQVQEDSVQVMTIHKSKGLEFNTVFLPELEEGVFPVSNIGGRKYWHILGGIFEKNKDKFIGNIEEDERKLFYVAVTRAKQNLFLYYELSTKNISRFVKESADSSYLDIDKVDLHYKAPRKNKEKDYFFIDTDIEEKQMRKTETYEQQKAYQEQIKRIRREVMDYYGSAVHFFPAARADLDRVSKLDEDELIAEARKLGIV